MRTLFVNMSSEAMDVEPPRAQPNAEEAEAMNIVDEEQEDELQLQFNALDEKTSSSIHDKINDFLLLMANPRTDDAAVKIKEQCIYR